MGELEAAEDLSRELGFTVETQRSELEAVQKAMATLRRAHLSEVRSLQAQLSSLGEWNSQLESERETASAMMAAKEKERERQRASLSAVAAERDIVAAQLAELSAQFKFTQSANSKKAMGPLVDEKEKEKEKESESESDSDSMLDMAAQQELMMARIIADRKANEAMLARLEVSEEMGVRSGQSGSDLEGDDDMHYGDEDLVAVQGLVNNDSVKVSRGDLKKRLSGSRWSVLGKEKKERRKVVQTMDEYLDYVDPQDGMGLIIADDDFF